MNKLLLFVFISCISTCVFGSTPAWVQESPNSAAANYPLPRYYHGWTSLGNTGVFFSGWWFDNYGDEGYLDDTWEYNVDTAVWTQTYSSSPLARAYFSTNLYGGQAVVFAGVGGTGYTIYNDIWRYTFSTHTWAQDTYNNLDTATEAKLARQNHAAAASGDTLYVVGGHSYFYDRTTNEVLAYNLVSNEWTILFGDTPASATAPPNRQDHTVNAYSDPLRGASLLVFGGYSDEVGSETGGYDDLWQFVITTKTWILLSTSGPSARYGHTSAYLDNVLYIYGGLYTAGFGQGGATTDTYYGDTWAYYPATGAWSQLIADSAAGAVGRRQGARSSSINDQFWFTGGYIQYVGLGNDVWGFA